MEVRGAGPKARQGEVFGPGGGRTERSRGDERGWDRQFVERRGDEGEEREPEEPYRVRRRIRDKTQKKVLEDEGVLVRLRALRSTIEEEEKAVTNDEPELMDIVVKALEGLKKEEEELRSSTEVEKDEEQILQTKIVSAKEVEMNLEDWKAPMKKELDRCNHQAQPGIGEGAAGEQPTGDGCKYYPARGCSQSNQEGSVSADWWCAATGSLTRPCRSSRGARTWWLCGWH